MSGYSQRQRDRAKKGHPGAVGCTRRVPASDQAALWAGHKGLSTLSSSRRSPYLPANRAARSNPADRFWAPVERSSWPPSTSFASSSSRRARHRGCRGSQRALHRHRDHIWKAPSAGAPCSAATRARSAPLGRKESQAGADARLKEARRQRSPQSAAGLASSFLLPSASGRRRAP